MVWQTLAALPDWLVVGVALAGVFSVIVAGIFLAGQRLIPSSPDRQKRRTDGSGDGMARRRAEIRHYFDAIGERYEEGRTIDDQHVDFYLPTRGVAVTFDAHVYFQLRSNDVEAVLVEHELPGIALGSRLPFETPTVTIDRSGGVPTGAFTELGLSTDAEIKEIERAYRDRVIDVHPDHGGDREEFRRLQEAYDAAKEHAR